MGEVDNNIRLGFERSRQRTSAQTLSGAILVSCAEQNRRIVSELNDGSQTYRNTPTYAITVR
jgi:hypothetical protein